MSKRLVMCCDGTWNTPDQLSGGKSCRTNVTKVALAVAPHDDSGREQRTFYHLGVGTSRGQRIRGGAFGFGLSCNVRDTYRFLVHNFEPGDELFFFGFSRGAFTARSTAGFIRNCGILRRSEEHRIDEAYDLYRSRASTTHPRGTEATLFRRTYSHETRIHFIGVWDTVGALGIPLIGLRSVDLLNRRWQFHDTSLSTTVDAAFQALAIDEKRGPFRPALWTQQPGASAEQQLEQVWFTGVHCDVGGGYLEHQLSDIALLWMVERAKSCGLSFDSDAFTRLPGEQSEDDESVLSQTGVNPNPYVELHNSRKRFYRVIPPYVRRPGVTDPGHEYVASSAVKSYKDMPTYRPPGLTEYLKGRHQIMAVDCE
jgi:uncharacterized protein (DUF2235 family)